MSTDIFKVSILHMDSIHCGFHLVPYIVETFFQNLPSSTHVLITDTRHAVLYLDFTAEFDGRLKRSQEDDSETLVVEGGRSALGTPESGKGIYLWECRYCGPFPYYSLRACQIKEFEANDRITGNTRMKQCTIGPLVDALHENVASISYLESQGCLTLSIASGLKGGHIRIAASISSQYVWSVLLCAPYAPEDITLELVGGQVVSQPYIDMTIAMMRAFGTDIQREAGENIYHIKRGVYRNPSEYAIESDASSATYPLAIAAITSTTCTIEIIGRSSSQGDARFAKEEGLRAGGLINMEPMTDAFLTASVLAAIATRPAFLERRVEGTTQIIGIANERHVWCLIIGEMAKFSVKTTKLDDDLKVHGQDQSTLKEGVSVHCYDDHRVAMAFSVLATRIKGSVIEEKRCVEKTWPGWWDDLHNKIEISVEGVDLEKASSSGSQTTHDLAASVFLIGMWGAGKSHIARLAGETLDWEVVDADSVFAQKVGNIKEFVKEKGWEEFRVAEAQVLREFIVEKSKELHHYVNHKGPVVNVFRREDTVVAYLEQDVTRPAYGESVRDVLMGRKPWYEECSSHNCITGSPLDSWDAVLWSPVPNIDKVVQVFFEHITGLNPNLCPGLTSSRRSYFLSLAYPDIIAAVPLMEELSYGQTWWD
ncbi:hypothetical protein M422DRAFT_270841 [Sphaerobolus stellatus SS14]|uniref:Enolpyruvate transferase domain-containing protein n=1 Tax=Sphaerobolus stellatus (strain SS14) TaxID=990650 RepID=A0A0C9U1L7_SPHS4|nr:hypothetical protein M422DRAFT_270841 [Sphaerobolus stellatus SS14]